MLSTYTNSLRDNIWNLLLSLFVLKHCDYFGLSLLNFSFRYESELLQRRENEEKVHHLQEQISFNGELSKQQQQDLQVSSLLKCTKWLSKQAVILQVSVIILVLH